jgi:hypothetical protein
LLIPEIPRARAKFVPKTWQLEQRRDPHSPEYKADFWYMMKFVFIRNTRESYSAHILAWVELSVLKQKLPLVSLFLFCVGVLWQVGISEQSNAALCWLIFT